MKLSIVIPAFNEAKRIEACLQSISTAVTTSLPAGWTVETIVVDNNSTDETASLARRHGVTVIFERVNQIARARNAGGLAASGDWILFIDADTIICPETLAEAIDCMRDDHVVGGGTILNYGKVAIHVRCFVLILNCVIRFFKMTPGCFLFCRTKAFREVGGFNEEFFAGEDAELGKALKRWGRTRKMSLAILHRYPPLTSDRKFHLYGMKEVLLAVGRYVLFPQRTMRDKRYLDIFYDGRR